MNAVTVIGVDCATKPRKMGLAMGQWHRAPREAELLAARPGGADYEGIVKELSGWIGSAQAALIALDSPLGWPGALAKALLDHRPGDAIEEEPDRMFRRVTDRVVHEQVGVRPLDVGADRIARTTHAALTLLQDLRAATGQAIAVAWEPGDVEDAAGAIEAYPAATLRAHGLPHSSYKKPPQIAERKRILDGLRARMQLRCGQDALLESADVLDAAVCVLAGMDFLDNRAIQPTEPKTAHREGWIWVRKPAATGTGSRP